MTLKPWREVAIPHEDVLKGTFSQADLPLIYRVFTKVLQLRNIKMLPSFLNVPLLQKGCGYCWIQSLNV
jgi:hypothetical protein